MEQSIEKRISKGPSINDVTFIGGFFVTVKKPYKRCMGIKGSYNFPNRRDVKNGRPLSVVYESKLHFLKSIVL